eukprot:g2675.t1
MAVLVSLVLFVTILPSAAASCELFSPEQDLTPHLACAPASKAPSRLVVFFPGTGGKPENVETWAIFSVDSGLHTLALAYPNNGTVGGLCYNRTDGCFVKLRRARQYGGTAAGLAGGQSVIVAKREAGDTRLRTALLALAESRPGAGWESFFRRNSSSAVGVEPLWERIVLAGHSQGAGQALLVGKDYSSERVLMFAGVDDVVPTANGTAVVPAPWISTAGATPASRLWGLGNVHGFCCLYWNANWPSLGVPGPPMSVDAPDTPPYGSSHFLCSAATVGNMYQAHGAVITRTDLYGAVWQQMLHGNTNSNAYMRASGGTSAAAGITPCACPDHGRAHTASILTDHDDK